MPSSNMIGRACMSAILIGTVAASITSISRADDWPQWRGPARDGVWRETGILEHFPSKRLPLVWRAEISSGYTGPSVADGRVFVMDRLVEPKQIERILCFDAKNGRPLWKHEYDAAYRIDYDAGPRASVTIDGEKAYALGAMGHFHCLDAATGRIIWARDLNAEYKIRMPIWGIAASPLIDRDLVIVQIGGADNACLVALDKNTGEERWRALPDNASYSAPIIVETGGKRVLVCYTGDTVSGLDPKSGRVHWSQPFPARKTIIGISTPVFSAPYLFITNFFDGALLLRLSKDGTSAEKVWQRAGESEQQTDALHSIISTPLINGDYIYGCDSYGELRCLKLQTGDRLWESDKAVKRERWANIHFIERPEKVENGVRVWMFNEQGELIIADLTPEGYREIDRTKLLDPTRDQLPSRRGGVCWSHPAFANRHVFARNDKELVCASLEK